MAELRRAPAASEDREGAARISNNGGRCQSAASLTSAHAGGLALSCRKGLRSPLTAACKLRAAARSKLQPRRTVSS